MTTLSTDPILRVTHMSQVHPLGVAQVAVEGVMALRLQEQFQVVVMLMITTREEALTVIALVLRVMVIQGTLLLQVVLLLVVLVVVVVVVLLLVMLGVVVGEVMARLVPRDLVEVDTVLHSHLREVAMAVGDPHQEGQESQIMQLEGTLPLLTHTHTGPVVEWGPGLPPTGEALQHRTGLRPVPLMAAHHQLQVKQPNMITQ